MDNETVSDFPFADAPDPDPEYLDDDIEDLAKDDPELGAEVDLGDDNYVDESDSENETAPEETGKTGSAEPPA